MPPCGRCCWIGMHLGREIGLDDNALHELCCTLLLKDLGCSSNAARICELYLTDDLSFKRDFKLLDGSLPAVMRFVIEYAGLNSGMAERFRTVLAIFRNGDRVAEELIETRCHRGAQIARQLRFGEPVAQGIQCLDEHWDGGGRPARLRGDAITAERPYRPALSVGKTLEIMPERLGTAIDPACFEAFSQAVSGGLR